MQRRFTRANVVEVFRQWPQAVSADEGDLRVLHDMANAGAQLWGDSLPWPDYLWLDFEGDLPNWTATNSGRETYKLVDPTGTWPAASFSAIKSVVDKCQFPPSGKLQISNRVLGMLELKVIETDFVPKLASYKPQMRWPDFLQMKFDQWFGNCLRDADKQVAGGRRLLPFCDALGVAVMVNERSTNLPSDLVLAYLTRALNHFENLDAILYLADGRNEPRGLSLVVKRDDARLKRFSTQVSMMLNSFDYEGALPVSRCGQQPELMARIEMESRSRAMYRSWSAGWRSTDDPTPIPKPSMTLSFVPRKEFVSGLPRTAPDPSLLDCRIRWDPDGKNLRVVSVTMAPREFFPDMPKEVFDAAFQPAIDAYGWPFETVNDSAKGTLWEKFLASPSLLQWSKFRWERGTATLKELDLHTDTRLRLKKIIETNASGRQNQASNLKGTNDRFWGFVDYIQGHGTLPTPVVGANTNRGLLVLDGYHRLAALSYSGKLEGFNLPMWLGFTDHAQLQSNA
jgi:hypothetical protein